MTSPAPSLVADHLHFVARESRFLGGRGDIALFIPPAEGGPMPLVILLNGVYGSHRAWAEQTGRPGEERAAHAAKGRDDAVRHDQILELDERRFVHPPQGTSLLDSKFRHCVRKAPEPSARGYAES